jgi:hypothetical protein
MMNIHAPRGSLVLVVMLLGACTNMGSLPAGNGGATHGSGFSVGNCGTGRASCTTSTLTVRVILTARAPDAPRWKLLGASSQPLSPRRRRL